MIKNYNYKPFLFFGITYLFTWIVWFLSSYFSYYSNNEALYLLLMILGLFTPTVVALVFILKKKELKYDLKVRLLNFKLIEKKSLWWLLLMPTVVVVSIVLSLMFGQDINQFNLSESIISVIAINIPFYLIISTFEETGWRGYGFTSLLSKFNLFKSSLIFGLLWAFWHFPLFFIKGYYHNEIALENIWFGVNFIVSVIPLAFIMGYIFKKNNYSILIIIMFHTVTNVMQEFFQMTQIAKCVETFVLFIIATIIVMFNKPLYFSKDNI